MSSMSGPILVDHEGDLASKREGMPWIWPAGARGLLGAVVIAAALGLAVASHSVPEPGAEVVKAPDLVIDLNTVPPGVLETLPHVGQSLVRQIVAAREIRPIASLDDAGSRVRGLGPSTLGQIAPYLRFKPSAQPGLADSTSAVENPPAAKSRSSGRKATRSRKPKSAAQPRLVRTSARVVRDVADPYDAMEFVAGAMIAGAPGLRRHGGETHPAAWVGGRATEESPDSTGRDGG